MFGRAAKSADIRIMIPGSSRAPNRAEDHPSGRPSRPQWVATLSGSWGSAQREKARRARVMAKAGSILRIVGLL